MAIRFPDDPKERIRVMAELARGKSVTYVISGVRVEVRPRPDIVSGTKTH